jgi:hypothetical protein
MKRIGTWIAGAILVCASLTLLGAIDSTVSGPTAGARHAAAGAATLTQAR